MKHKQIWMAIFVLMAGLSVWAGAQVADKAVDPVCGMSVATDGAKWTLDYKGTTYYFCNEKCKEAFAKEPEKFLAKKTAEMPAGPEGGGACCPKMAHIKKVQAQAGMPMPLAAEKKCEMMAGAQAKAEMPAGQGCGCCCMKMMNRMGMGMKMPHKHMMAGPMGQGMPMGPGMMGMGMGPGMMMMKDVEKKVEITKDGVVITITSKNPETVKMIQEHIAEMAKREAEMMKRAAGDKEVKIEIKEEKK
ncbi:MAG: YHS domain-containing protein [Candidatus Aminicenantales bacterium]